MYGGKADNLGKMRDAGLPVKPFVVLPWDIREDNDKIGKILKPFLAADKKYAVRSSANLEDSAAVSFAGGFNTDLNVAAEDVPAAVRNCFGSVSGRSLEEYMEKTGTDGADLQMNVVVQEMVESDISGIIFTANPMGLLSESVITAGRGLGDLVVEDKTDTTTYYYNLTDKNYYYEGEEILSQSQVEELISLSSEVKKLIGDYADIEFGIEKGKIWLLQARPITTIDDSAPVILDSSNIVESYPGISLPLTCSFVHLAYTGVFRAVAKRIVGDQKIIDSYSDVLNDMIDNCNGRIYYKISNWYTIIKFLPMSKKIIPVWQDMLGVKNKTVTGRDVKLPPFRRAATYINSIRSLSGVPSMMDGLNEKFWKINDRFYSEFSKDMTKAQKKELFDAIKSEVLDIWDITLLNDMYTFIYTGLSKSRLKKKYEDYETRLNGYIGNITDLESAKPVRALINLAYDKDKISPEEYEDRSREFIKLYGDRYLEELKLETVTYSTDPALLDRTVENYRKDPERLSRMHEDINKGSASEIKEGFLTRKYIRKSILGIKNREISRLNRARLYGIVRRIFLSIGEDLYQRGKIDEIRDIFYLTVDEVWDGNEDEYRSVISSRKEAYDVYRLLPFSSRLIFSQKVFNKQHLSVGNVPVRSSGETLKGTPASSGKAVGEVLIIDDINKEYDVRGKILVTKQTDPGWVYLLANSAGVVSEKGSLLSHTAIISRELKVPSVVGVPHLMESLKTGDRIELDADNGTIRRI